MKPEHTIIISVFKAQNIEPRISDIEDTNVNSCNDVLLSEEVFRKETALSWATPPTECRRRAGAVFVTCSRHVVHELYVARFL